MNKLNKIILSILLVLSLIMFVETNNFKYLIFIAVIIVPFLIKFNNFFTTIYLIFIFSTLFLGMIYGLYQTTNWYDSFSHFLWGIVSSLIAVYIMDILKMFEDKNIIFNMLFIFVFSLATACIWEVIEFIIDKLLLTNMQRKETGIEDTMKDINITILGSILFLISFYYEYTNNEILLIKKSREMWSNGRTNNNNFKNN